MAREEIVIGKVRVVFPNPEDVARSYQGRVGCMCGCKGTYSEDPKTTAKRLKTVLALIARDDYTEITVDLDWVYVEYETGQYGEPKCYCFYLRDRVFR